MQLLSEPEWLTMERKPATGGVQVVKITSWKYLSLLEKSKRTSLLAREENHKPALSVLFFRHENARIL